jgi:hypothetical protein
VISLQEPLARHHFEMDSTIFVEEEIASKIKN